MTFALWFAILLIIFAIIGFIVFVICGFLFLVWLIFREKPMKYTENYDNCPYFIEGENDK